VETPWPFRFSGGEMTDEELIGDFEAGRVPRGGFHHAQHVRVAWYYVRAYGLPAALVRFTGNLRTFAKGQGKPELYHETVTIAFMLIIAERLADAEPTQTWDAFAAQHPDLLSWKPSVLDRYYLPETLWSERARRAFVMPDRL
jgi:hypothetical protein